MFYKKCSGQIWSLAECCKLLTIKLTDLTGARFQFCLCHLLAGWVEAKPFVLWALVFPTLKQEEHVLPIPLSTDAGQWLPRNKRAVPAVPGLTVSGKNHWPLTAAQGTGTFIAPQVQPLRLDWTPVSCSHQATVTLYPGLCPGAPRQPVQNI